MWVMINAASCIVKGSMKLKGQHGLRLAERNSFLFDSSSCFDLTD
jgi:hypothetical protein